MAERPGIMFYFDLEPALSMLTDSEAGQLFRAAMEYGHFGVIPELAGMAAMAWAFVKPKIDRDNEAYRQKCKDNAYNRYKGVCKDRGEIPLSKEVWEERVYSPSLTLVDNGSNSSPTTEGTRTSKANSAPTAESAAEGAGKGKAKGVRGE